MKQPLIVYLDTSDFSSMYRCEPSSSVANVREDLISRVKHGEVRFGVSFIHFFEFLQPAQAPYEKDRSDRIRFLRLLTEDWSFPFYMDLTNQSVLQNGPYWMPADALRKFDIDGFSERLRAKLYERASERTLGTRKDRRRLRNKSWFVEFVRNNPQILSSLTADTEKERELYDGLLESGLLRKYILGGIARTEANHIFRSRCLNLAAVYHWYFSSSPDNPVAANWDRIHTNWARSFATLSESLQRCSSEFEALEQLSKQLKEIGAFAPSELKQENKRISQSRKELKSLISRPVKLEEDLLKTGPDSEVVDLQFRANGTAAFNAIVTGKLVFERSAIGDLLHSLYLPYCDLWRGDRAFAHVLKADGVPFSARIVTRLAHLPERIETTLKC